MAHDTSKHGKRGVVLILAALLLMGAALAHLLPDFLNRMKSDETYDALAADYVTETAPDSTQKDWWQTDIRVDFENLQKENPDIVAWLRFDNQEELGINYPVLYSGDNQTYLRTDIYGDYSIAGCIFLEGLNTPDFSDLYSILYGHNLNDDRMFGTLLKYKNDDFYENNQYFTLYTEKVAYRYQIFAYENAVNGGAVYQIGYQPDDTYQAFLEKIKAASLKDTGISPDKTQKVLTLSTCTGDGRKNQRFAVQAVCIDEQNMDDLTE